MNLRADADTQLYFQIGYPLDFSCAASLHNAMFEYANVNAVSLNIEVEPGHLGEFCEAVKALKIGGFDITMPHKSAIIPFLDEVDDISRDFPDAVLDEAQAALLEAAALAESYSSHPIAQSLREAWGQSLQGHQVEQVQERPGHGVRALVNGAWVAAGSEGYLASLGFRPEAQAGHVGTLVHVARGETYLGYIHIADQLKPDAIQAISGLRAAGVEKLVMLTGDSTPVAAHMAALLGLDEFHSELLPEDKVTYMEALRAQLHKGALVFVGDGINDAPVLAQADVGIAMGGLGSDAAIEAADVVIMDDHPARIPVAISIARRTMAIVWQNIVFALGVKAIVLVMGALGVATMWEAVFADVGVSVIAILNSMRALQLKHR